MNSIPTATVLKSRKLTESAACTICGADEDDWEHAILNCTMARCVWALLDEDVTEMIDQLRIADLQQWVFHICDKLPEEDGIKILVTCWAIWHARRKATHEGGFQSPLATISVVNQLIYEFQVANGM